MRDGGLGHIEGGHDITDAHLAFLQHPQNLLPCIVGQGLAELDAVDHYSLL